MAIYTYGLAYGDVVQEVPMIDSSSITATTEPLSTGNITQYIEDGAGKLNSMLTARGVTPGASMDETDHAALVEAIKGYAVSKCLLVLGTTGDLYDQAWERWQSVYAEYSNRPQQLGGTFAPMTTVTIDAIEVDGGIASHDDHGTEEWSFISMNGRQQW